MGHGRRSWRRDLDLILDRHLRERREEKGDGFEGMWIGYCRGEMGFAGVRGDLGPTSGCGAPRLRRREFDLEGGGGGTIWGAISAARSRLHWGASRLVRSRVGAVV